ncbi:tight adherence protein B [Homoserinimonas aerilata]|uniref:Tight adherence protein B n=1 Tax=Homoserinimonas aerilata TaxID=1162970 RepID=A0A542YKY3_9MICO|nr:type II secretion system F family protein [Homoserinimonas aerilata]TQL48745.1 tight adherence protein B [Homoserinimonas aerilata]
MRRARPADDRIAAVVQRLGVLLSAGVTPASAWAHLAETAGAPEGVVRVAEAVSEGETIPDAVLARAETAVAARPAPPDAELWRGLAAAWMVATETGAPLASTLDALAGSLRDMAQTRRARETALAAPVATARLVLALPTVGILFGLALGFDTVGTLLTTPIGLVCLVAGVALMVAARAWNRRLMAGAEPTKHNPGIALDLVAVAVSGGAALDRALATVERALERCGLGGGTAEADEVLELSRRAGVPAAALLRAQAEEARRSARADGERSAATLSVTLMLPLGLCILPAFMLLGVAPLMVSVVTTTVGGL